jgi:hypothetical protein
MFVDAGKTDDWQPEVATLTIGLDMLIEQTDDKAIQLHDNEGLYLVETAFDEMVLIDGRWWECDIYTGEILNEVVGH